MSEPSAIFWISVTVIACLLLGYWVGYLGGWQAYHDAVIKSAIEDAKAAHGIGGEA